LKDLRTPLSEEAVRALRVGDRVSLTGQVFSMRDQASMRILSLLEEEIPVPVRLEEGVVFHAGPAVDASGPSPRIVSVGPTTSARMNSIMPKLISLLRLRCIIGKGGMDRAVLQEMSRTGCVYLSALGGCAALYTASVKGIKGVVWPEMGPEALYELEVEGMSPLVVTMDSHGRSMHEEIDAAARRRLAELLADSPEEASSDNI